MNELGVPINSVKIYEGKQSVVIYEDRRGKKEFPTSSGDSGRFVVDFGSDERIGPERLREVFFPLAGLEECVVVERYEEYLNDYCVTAVKDPNGLAPFLEVMHTLMGLMIDPWNYAVRKKYDAILGKVNEISKRVKS